jgi:SAM-dependent methyltransferase
MRHKTLAELHSTPIDQYDNLLDRLSNIDRFRYYGEKFLLTEKFLVQKKIISTVKSGSILNVGCGRNGTERRLFPAPNYKLFGIDVNEESLRILRSRELYDRLFKASITALPFESGYFDVVYLRLILHHLVYPKNLIDSGLQECFRVLKKDGTLALIEPNSWHPIGALMNITHALGIDKYVHGTDDDVALSPLMLQKQLAKYSDTVTAHVVTYSWRRLPIGIQLLTNRLHTFLGSVSDKTPYFGHTLMMIAAKK